MLCIAHRGARGHAPENTLAAIKKALQLGAPSIEIDVYQVDGHLVVFHDDRLERTTNGSGYLLDHKFSELRQLDAGNGQTIPTLQEVLQTIDQAAAINIELKGPQTAVPVLQVVDQFRQSGWANDLFLISSFNHRELVEARRLDAGIKIGALTSCLPVNNAEFAERLGSYSVHPSIEFVDPLFVRDAQRRGLRVYVFTVNHADDIDKMQRIGVDGVFTDYPERVLSIQSAVGSPVGWF